jgi:transcriptional regulator with XRE-family HTH domain
MTKIYDNIRAVRVLKNLSQEYVAETLGVSQSAYGKLERGETRVTWEKLERISEVLGTTPFLISSFRDANAYQTNTDPQLAAEASEVYIRQNRDINQLKDKIEMLEEMNSLLKRQLQDKDEIINLLRPRHEAGN